MPKNEEPSAEQIAELAKAAEEKAAEEEKAKAAQDAAGAGESDDDKSKEELEAKAAEEEKAKAAIDAAGAGESDDPANDSKDSEGWKKQARTWENRAKKNLEELDDALTELKKYKSEAAINEALKKYELPESVKGLLRVLPSDQLEAQAKILQELYSEGGKSKAGGDSKSLIPSGASYGTGKKTNADIIAASLNK